MYCNTGGIIMMDDHHDKISISFTQKKKKKPLGPRRGQLEVFTKATKESEQVDENDLGVFDYASGHQQANPVVNETKTRYALKLKSEGSDLADACKYAACYQRVKRQYTSNCLPLGTRRSDELFPLP